MYNQYSGTMNFPVSNSCLDSSESKVSVNNSPKALAFMITFPGLWAYSNKYYLDMNNFLSSSSLSLPPC